jgi:hypothetical protein
MKKNVELTPEIIKAVYDDIMNKHGMTKREVCDYITQCSNNTNQSREEYILDYYKHFILKDDECISDNIEDIDKVNFEELTETDKKVIASRKYMCHEYVKELIRYINKLINIELSNDRHAVDETAVIVYAIQAINRDVVNAVGDTQRILELIKQKRP